MTLKKVAFAVALACASQAYAATNFDSFTPLASSYGTPIPVNDPLEATPFKLANPAWTQLSISDRNTQLGLGQQHSGWPDMIDTNRTGPDAGRYLFMPFEPSNPPGSGAQRIDLWTGVTTTLVNPATQGWGRGDASRWTPWGGWLSGEENWGAGATGRVFEITNPVTATGPGDTNLVQRNIVPRVSHEGMVFDSANAFYFVDENSSGSIYKYVSTNANASNGNDYFASGQTFVAKVSGGGVTGNFAWEAITDVNGVPLGSTLGSVVNGGGVLVLDGRSAADAVGGTAYNRPEDMEITTLGNGDQMIVFAATGTHEAYSMNLATMEMKLFASRSTIDLATGAAVGNAFSSPDNIAIDANGNFYIVEDQPGGVADIWMARDADNDGVAESVARWATMGTTGAEPTGLYFDINNPNLAYVNIQHPDGLNDRTIQISAVPEPGTYAMMLCGLGLVGFALRKRQRQQKANSFNFA